MIAFRRPNRILLFAEPADMRKGRNGLQCLVLRAGEDPYCGDLFVFISRRRDRAKLLTSERGGMILWYKRLEKCRFQHPRRDGSQAELEPTALSMLHDGIDLDAVPRPVLWEPRQIKEKAIDNAGNL